MARFNAAKTWLETRGVSVKRLPDRGEIAYFTVTSRAHPLTRKGLLAEAARLGWAQAGAPVGDVA